MTDKQKPEPLPCRDCATEVGQPHSDGCDVARCTVCGWQRISCEHGHRNIGWGQTWTGIWPGKVEAEELDWWSRWDDEHGWVVCGRNEPGASADLNAIASAAQQDVLDWDRRQQRWVVSPQFKDHIAAITAERRRST